MSCNGCRVLRKGCSENCILRPCIQWIETADAQGHATVFVAKFFGRAGLMSFISAVPEPQRPALFQSLLYEACGRTVNPVNGAIGMLWTGNWNICQAAVETVLRGGSLRPIPELLAHGGGFAGFPSEEGFSSSRSRSTLDSSAKKRKRVDSSELDLSLNPNLSTKTTPSPTRQRSGTPSMNSEESVATTTSFWDATATGERYGNGGGGETRQLLNLFV
ncbi:BnaAnng05130D [Brassica napus]|uniref:BnaAnng05130D protein n=1 Tax=Brassica napus TaxID=3708 RepID=A0A078HJ13_BRANA|nr:BnaAnng05130D [Brassica napus]